MNIKENKLVTYLIESKAELKKVSWPTKKETIKYTITIVAISAFVAVFFGILNFIFTKLLATVI
ncbi:preprotein translocase subunit SecE [Candidatus Falkowbacteria bacterium]|jgi:preprotein translocase subunit SecE|nr:preprotein translocase subunit SecE [Candidatus Falkowbacteria bacterium]MBT7007659.1 preprotein translocase subunit SecE [Candidatus Falkowbacteria bacterium]